MANRYWVGGTETWNATVGTKWALTSGGVGGQAVPTSSDDVFIDNFSGASVITAGAALNCLSLNFADGTGGAFVGTFAGAAQAINIYGSLKLTAGMTISGTGLMGFRSTAAGRTIDWAGKTWTGDITFLGAAGEWSMNAYTATKASSTFTVNAVGAAVTVTGNINMSSLSSTIIVTSGSLTLGAITVAVGYVTGSGAVARGLDLGSAVITIAAASGFVITGTNLTFAAGTSSIVFTAAAQGLHFASHTMYDVECQGGVGLITISGSNTFHNFKVNPTTTKTVTITAGEEQTITGVCEYNGATWDITKLPVGIPITAQASDNYAPSLYTTQITISCTATADAAFATINGITISLPNVGGNNWSKTIHAGYFGAGAAMTIYFTATTTAGDSGVATAASTITIPVIVAKSNVLLTEITASLTGAGITATVSLMGEEVIGSQIRSLIKVLVVGYSVTTIDAIRTTVGASAAGWSGTVTSTEYAAPYGTVNSVVIFKMLHS